MSRVVVAIETLDQNDNAPELDRQYTTSICDSSAPGQVRNFYFFPDIIFTLKLSSCFIHSLSSFCIELFLKAYAFFFLFHYRLAFFPALLKP